MEKKKEPKNTIQKEEKSKISLKIWIFVREKVLFLIVMIFRGCEQCIVNDWYGWFAFPSI